MAHGYTFRSSMLLACIAVASTCTVCIGHAVGYGWRLLRDFTVECIAVVARKFAQPLNVFDLNPVSLSMAAKTRSFDRVVRPTIRQQWRMCQSI